MTLGIDAHRLCGPRFGVGRYLEYLLKHWADATHPFGRITLYAPCSLEPPRLGGADVRTRRIGALAPLLAFHHLLLPRHARDLDLLFCPAYFAPLAYRGRYVVTHLGSYEAIQDTFPWWHRYRYRAMYARSARGAELVITVSHSSARDIVRFYGVDPARIRVIPLGVDETFSAARDERAIAAWRETLGIGEAPVVLFVGKLSARRCIPALLEAFAAVRGARHLAHVLVLAGSNELRLPLDAEAARLGITAAFRHVPYVSHDRLPALYHLADAFIYPSTYEGFGIPVVEAMASGTPAITLDNTALSETATGAAYLAPDGSVPSLARALDEVLTDASLRRELRERGLERAGRYRWDRIARETMEVLIEAVGRA